MTINTETLEKLHKHLYEDKGSSELSDIAAFVGGGDDDARGYINALKENHPDIYGAPTKPVAKKAAKKVAKKAAKKVAKADSAPRKILLMNENGTTTELEVVKDTDKVLALKEYVEPDIVSILVRGGITEIDLAPIRSRPDDEVIEPYGMTVAMLIALGDVSKG